MEAQGAYRSRAAGIRILVVSAGMAGLGTARALQQVELTADVIERAPTRTHTGAGICLPGNAARALRALGLESAVVQRAAVITRQRFCDHRDQMLADIDLTTLWGDVGPCLALHRAGPASLSWHPTAIRCPSGWVRQCKRCASRTGS